MDSYINSFRDKLKRINPGSDFSDFFLKRFFIEKEELLVLERKEANDVISFLVENYKTKNIRFGDFGFLEEIQIFDDEIKIFAKSSFSYLGFRFGTSLKISEYDSENFVELEEVAADGYSFLDAYLSLMEVYSLRLQGKVDRDDERVNEEFLKRCAVSAGGERYKRFYKNIIF